MTKHKNSGDAARRVPRFFFAVAGAGARALRRAIWWVRQVTGDAAYENYLRCVCRESANASRTKPKLLSAKEFYLDSVRRRYSTPSRCC